MKKPICPHITPDFRCPIMQANGRKGGWKKGRKRAKRAKSLAIRRKGVAT